MPVYILFLFVLALNPNREEIERLHVFLPFISLELIGGLITELPSYLGFARDFRFTAEKMGAMAIEVERFWIQNCLQVKHWFSAFRVVALFSTSSGAAERLISFFSYTIGIRGRIFINTYLTLTNPFRCDTNPSLRGNPRGYSCNSSQCKC